MLYQNGMESRFSLCLFFFYTRNIDICFYVMVYYVVKVCIVFITVVKFVAETKQTFIMKIYVSSEYYYSRCLNI